MPADQLEGVALVTGGGRGIGASIARELSDAGMKVAVTGRTAEQVNAVASEIEGLALTGDVASADDVERWVTTTERELGSIELLVANAGMGAPDSASWDLPVEDWWRVQEVNVLGVHLATRSVIPLMLDRGRGRIVITGSGSAYLPGTKSTAYATSKAAVCRYGETLANELAGRIPVFHFSPGLVQTELTAKIWRRSPVDAARARTAARPGARIWPRRRACRALHPRRTRRHRGSHRSGRPDRRRRSQRDPPPPLTNP